MLRIRSKNNEAYYCSYLVCYIQYGLKHLLSRIIRLFSFNIDQHTMSTRCPEACEYGPHGIDSFLDSETDVLDS